MQNGPWPWWKAGLALGAVFLLAVALVKPIGVSTQFVIADGIAWRAVDGDVVRADAGAKSGWTSDNPYIAKSGGKYAAAIANPVNYSFVFVLAMIGGAALAAFATRQRPTGEDRFSPAVWRETYGPGHGKRYAATFLGGVLALFGARLAGGCTSGHMMSGMMQTSLSGYLFALAAFATSIPLAWLMFNRGRRPVALPRGERSDTAGSDVGDTGTGDATTRTERRGRRVAQGV